MRVTQLVACLGMVLVSLGLGLPAAAQTTPAYTLKIATTAPEGTPWAKGITDFKVQAESLSGKKLTVKPFLGGVLGDENETVQSCQRGQIQGVGVSTGALATVVPELSVVELPYLFKSQEEADFILDSVILNAVEKALEAKGLVLGFWSENGYRSFGTTFGFVKSPADLKGHKMRSQENPIHLAMYRSFGASPVPIPVTEVLTSLQTGVIDGYDNTVLFASAAQWTSATKYFTLTNHIYQPAAIVYNKAWFDGLPKDVQDAVKSPRTGLVTQMRGEIRALTPILVDNLSAMKVQVYTPSAAERAAFEAAGKVARDTWLKTATTTEKALYDKIVAGQTMYRKAHP